MKEDFDLGPTPYDETCAQVGEKDYEENARKECTAYKNQLVRLVSAKYRRVLKRVYDAGDFSINSKSNRHDFGSYRSVVVRFNPDNEIAALLACWVENNTPGEWDEDAKEELWLAFNKTIWTCDRCGVSKKQNKRGRHACFTKKDIQTTTEDDEPDHEMFCCNPTEVGDLTICPECIDKHYKSCGVCDAIHDPDEGYPWPDSQDIARPRSVCGEDCLSAAEHKEGEDQWASHGESAAHTFINELCDVFGDGDTEAAEKIAEAIFANETAMAGMQRAFDSMYSYAGHFGVPKNLEDGVWSFAGLEDEAKFILSLVPGACPTCGRKMVVLKQMRNEKLATDLPATIDDTSWEELKRDHEDDCEFYKTRGHRYLPPNEETRRA